MFKIRLKGRLGNQLFIYSFARSLVEKYGTKVIIYDRKSEDNSMWYSHLDNYHLNTNIIFSSDKAKVMNMSLDSKILFAYDRLRTKNMTPRDKNKFQLRNLNKFLKHRLFLLTDGYVELPSTLNDNTFFDGYFQSPKYFDDIRDSLLKELRPVHVYSKEEKEFINEITHSNSVCLTIRLGDYLGNSTHQVCTKEFYEKAMDRMNELYPDCKFFVFSDDVKKAKEIFNFKYPVIFDSGNMRDYVSLHVMSKCNNFIISNSSFSWWAQYLSQNPHKTVIAPDRWYAQDVPCDIYQDNWLKIKV